MTDYISRGYTVENIENYPWDTEHDKNAAIHLVRELVPAADVVEVVRCKDCKHYKEGKLLGPTKFCYYYQIGTGLNTADDDFCSKGERLDRLTKIPAADARPIWNFCPYCGALMLEVPTDD